MGGVYGKDDFLLTANISSSIGDYEVQLNKSGFIKDHPEEIKRLVYRICYAAKFDQDLKNFQLKRRKWKTFKKLFEAVTVFEIEEQMKDMYFKQYKHSPQLARKLWLDHYEKIHHPYNLLKNRCFGLLDKLDIIYFKKFKKQPPNWKY